MSSAPQSSLYNIISLSLIVSGLVAVGLISGLIPGVFTTRPGADEPAMQLEAKAEAVSATEAVIANPASMVITDHRAAADQAGNSGAGSPVLLTEANERGRRD